MATCTIQRKNSHGFEGLKQFVSRWLSCIHLGPFECPGTRLSLKEIGFDIRTSSQRVGISPSGLPQVQEGLVLVHGA